MRRTRKRVADVYVDVFAICNSYGSNEHLCSLVLLHLLLFRYQVCDCCCATRCLTVVWQMFDRVATTSVVHPQKTNPSSSSSCTIIMHHDDDDDDDDEDDDV